MLDGNVPLRQKRDEAPNGTLSCPDRNLPDFGRNHHYEGICQHTPKSGKVLIPQSLFTCFTWCDMMSSLAENQEVSKIDVFSHCLRREREKRLCQLLLTQPHFDL